MVDAMDVIVSRLFCLFSTSIPLGRFLSSILINCFNSELFRGTGIVSSVMFFRRKIEVYQTHYQF